MTEDSEQWFAPQLAITLYASVNELFPVSFGANHVVGHVGFVLCSKVSFTSCGSSTL